MRLFLLGFFLLVIPFVKAQLNGSLIDTIKSGYSISNQLDSSDLLLGIQSSSLTGGGFNLNNNLFSARSFIEFNGGQRFFAYSPWKKLRFSALPHLGFSYSFGNKGTQHILAEYQHALSTKSLLNIDFNRYSSTGFIRNSEFTHNDLQIQYSFNGKRYQSNLKLGYQNSNVQQSGGLSADSLIKSLDLLYIPVAKENALTKTQLGRIEWQNYLDFDKDSLQAKGIFTAHKISAKNYSYSESDSLANNYTIINFDSLQTNDIHQFTRLDNAIGLFSKNSFHEFTVGINTGYWQFKNAGFTNDTLEIATFLNFKRERKTSFIQNHFEFNLVGAKNEWSNYFSFIKKLKSFEINGAIAVLNKLPEVYQRLAIGNNYSNLNGTFNKQFNTYSDITVSKAFSNLTTKIGYRFSLSKNNYFFKETQWKQDTVSNYVIHQFYLKLDYKLKFLYLQPHYTYSILDESTDFIPQHQLQARVFIKGGIFKAKKLKAYLGADFSYASSFRQVTFNSITSSFDFNNSNAQLLPQMNLHVFGGIQIEEFKFFVRVENIGRSWNETTSAFYKGYPIASTQFRVGITWDFFN